MFARKDVDDRKLANYQDKWWRLNHLYYFIDDQGKERLFKANKAQQDLWNNRHYFNLILKARQLGFTTFIQLWMLDEAVFVPNTQCGMIAHRLDDAVKILRTKARYAYERLPDWVKAMASLTKDNETELAFSNGSFINVGISLRSGTYNLVHISEYGKICAKFPEKAREIQTGALNTLAPGSMCFIESTAEGASGQFYDLCQEALAKARIGVKLSKLDFRLHFFPWMDDPKYQLPTEGVVISATDQAMFAKLEGELGRTITPEQRAWYVKKKESQADDMMREFPSEPAEAFRAATEGQYFAKHILAAEAEGRVASFPANPERPVYTFWDLGIGDRTCIWFVQYGENERRYFFDFYENEGYGLGHYVRILQEKGFQHRIYYAAHIAPHDANARGPSADIDPTTWVTLAAECGLELTVMKRIADMQIGINECRRVLPLCYFDQANCKEGVRALRSYTKRWDEGRGAWSNEPYHNWASHAVKAFEGHAFFSPYSRTGRKSPGAEGPLEGRHLGGIA